MAKVIKKFEHKALETVRRGIKHDWDLILSGQNVCLDAGVDYDQVGHDKEGKEFDRTDAFSRTIEFRADEKNKKVSITRIDAQGKAITNRKAAAAGIVVTAIDMTADEVQARDERRKKSRQIREAKEAANGTQPKAEQVPMVEAEPLA